MQFNVVYFFFSVYNPGSSGGDLLLHGAALPVPLAVPDNQYSTIFRLTRQTNNVLEEDKDTLKIHITP